MILPPSLVRLSWHRRPLAGIWIPLFLLWPLVLLLLAPVFLIAGVVALAQGWLPRFLHGSGACYRLLCEVRGIRIDVAGRQSGLSIRIY